MQVFIPRNLGYIRQTLELPGSLLPYLAILTARSQSLVAELVPGARESAKGPGARVNMRCRRRGFGEPLSPLYRLGDFFKPKSSKKNVKPLRWIAWWVGLVLSGCKGVFHQLFLATLVFPHPTCFCFIFVFQFHYRCPPPVQKKRLIFIYSQLKEQLS